MDWLDPNDDELKCFGMWSSFVSIFRQHNERKTWTCCHEMSPPLGYGRWLENRKAVMAYGMSASPNQALEYLLYAILVLTEDHAPIGPFTLAGQRFDTLPVEIWKHQTTFPEGKGSQTTRFPPKNIAHYDFAISTRLQELISSDKDIKDRVMDETIEVWKFKALDPDGRTVHVEDIIE